MSSRLALGTVQFGMPYGIANRSGQVCGADAARIIEQARSCGVDTVDTAIAYGDSERALGQIGMSGWRVVSKLPELPEDCGDVRGWARESVLGSLERLAIPSLYGLLLHRSEALMTTRGAALYSALSELRAHGLVHRIGVSIYSPQELDRLSGSFSFDIVQAPFNVVDRRMETSGWLKRLKDQGAEIHSRSAFLQGLLLLTALERPAKFARWSSLWKSWDRWLAQTRQTAVEACLRFSLCHPDIDRVVIGVDSTAQLSASLAVRAEGSVLPPPELSSEDPDLINPSRWSSL